MMVADHDGAILSHNRLDGQDHTWQMKVVADFGVVEHGDDL